MGIPVLHHAMLIYSYLLCDWYGTRFAQGAAMEIAKTSLAAFATILCTFGACNAALGRSDIGRPRVPAALFVFGDSLADAGNNNFIPNTSSRANFPPYGETFFHRPTGRFTNGRTVYDLIAARLKIQFPPPFLKPGADFSQGINFASGGSGLLDSTGKHLNIIPLSQQIEQFANISLLAKPILSKSLYAISIGGNDFGLNYLANSTFQKTTSPEDFVKLLLGKYNEYLRRLYQIGARNFIVGDVGPVGCIPSWRLAEFRTWKGECVDSANQLVVVFNAELTRLINHLNSNLKDATILHIHYYDLNIKIIQHGQAFGFSETRSACCGAGAFNTAVSCGIQIPENERENYKPFLCKNPDEYLFWDGTHPTERLCRMISRLIWVGNFSFITPFNLKTLVQKLNAHKY